MRDTVSFSQDSFHATIYLPSLLDLPLKNVCKIFTTMLWDDRENEQAIQNTKLFLEDIVPESKQTWDAAIRAHNDGLTRDVKKAKRQYERWVKIQALWNDTKHKMKIM